MRTGRWNGALCATALALLGGCTHGPPKGQVVATVDGQEITAADIAAEARALGEDGVLDDPAGYRMLVRRVVERTLLARSAEHQGLDRDPKMLADLARLRQAYLADAELTQALGTPAAVTDDRVAAFIAAHPAYFRDRPVYALDEVTFRPAGKQADLTFLADADTIREVTTRLQQTGMAFAHAPAMLDTGTLPVATAARLAKLPDGALFSDRTGPVVHVAAIVRRSTVHLSDERRHDLAARLIVRQQRAADEAALLQRLRAHATIRYRADLTAHAR